MAASGSFRGGKVEPGESPEEAVRREVREELGVDCDAVGLLHRRDATYDDGGRFDVGFYLVERWTGTPRALASSELAWVAPDRFGEYDILEGSREICRILESR